MAAEDVVIRVFLLILQKLEEFEASQVSFRSLFLGKVRELAIGERRRSDAARWPELRTGPGEKGQDAAWSGPHPTAGIPVIAALPDEQRQVLELAYYAGMTCAEISQALGEPPSLVQTWAQLGFARLREHLQQTDTHQVILSRMAWFDGQGGGSAELI